jgi:hypothetical protein
MTNQYSQASQVSKMNTHKTTAYARIQNDGTDEQMQEYHLVMGNTSNRLCFDPNIQTDSGVHPAFYSMSTMGYSTGLKWPRCEANH